MSAHHFNKSLNKEQKASRQADAFYLSDKFQATIVERYNLNTKEHLAVQRQDIDVSLLLENRKQVSVSEKFRAHDYDDLLLEIYSKYPDTQGWLHKSEAGRLAYFFPTRMFWIDKKSLQEFCVNKLFPTIENQFIEELLSQKANSLVITLSINYTQYNCRLTQAPNNTNGDTWNTISISVPFKMLADFKIRWQEFKL